MTFLLVGYPLPMIFAIQNFILKVDKDPDTQIPTRPSALGKIPPHCSSQIQKHHGTIR